PARQASRRPRTLARGRRLLQLRRAALRRGGDPPRGDLQAPRRGEAKLGSRQPHPRQPLGGDGHRLKRPPGRSLSGAAAKTPRRTRGGSSWPRPDGEAEVSAPPTKTDRHPWRSVFANRPRQDGQGYVSGALLGGYLVDPGDGRRLAANAWVL